MQIVAALVMACVVVAGWFAQLLGLPGNWLIVAAAGLYAWSMPGENSTAVGWHAVIALALLAVAGEIVELVAGALGVAKLGGSRRGALLAVVGSIVGSTAGVFVGLPIPLIGSLVGAIFFGGVGALAGALIGEVWKGRDFETSLEIGKAAFVGRLLGTAAKMIVSSIMVVVALAALVF